MKSKVKPTKSKTCPMRVLARDTEGQKHREGKTEKERKHGRGYVDKTEKSPQFPKRPYACILFHHRAGPQTNPALSHKESGKCTHNFIPPKDIVVMLVKAKPHPVKHIPFSVIENYVNPCKGLSTVCAIQSYQCGLLIRKCKVGHL